MVELKLTLTDSYDVVKIYHILYNKKKSYENDNHRHKDMIRLLEGNENNEEAKYRLRCEQDDLKNNNEEIKFIDDLIKQLEPIVDKHFENR